MWRLIVVLLHTGTLFLILGVNNLVLDCLSVYHKTLTVLLLFLLKQNPLHPFELKRVLR